MQTVISAIFVFMLVILIHEFGHFIVAKKVGIKVNEFSIGMGPKLLQKEKGETKYTLRALPIGGYVQMEGEDENSDDSRSFASVSILSRIAVIAAGAMMNFILAIILLSIISFSVGQQTTTIDIVIPDTPAQFAGIDSGDIILSIDNNEIKSWSNIITSIENSSEEEIDIDILRNEEILSFKLKPIIKDGSKIIGIQPTMERGIIQSIKGGFNQTFYMIKSIFEIFAMLFKGEIGSEVLSGPVGVITEINKATKAGFIYILLMMAMISVNLGVFNLLPIPGLDGSRILFLIIESVRGEPMDPKKEGFIHFLGFAFLISLMLFITYKDVVSLIFRR